MTHLHTTRTLQRHVRKLLGREGCLDGQCILRDPEEDMTGKQKTNGGCSCLKDLRRRDHMNISIVDGPGHDAPLLLRAPRQLADVLAAVVTERARQDAKWGADRTQPDAHAGIDNYEWDRRHGATHMLGILSAKMYRSMVEASARRGELSWSEILMEEVAEAAEEGGVGNLALLYVELIQVAAVAVAWAEDVKRRMDG